MLRTVDSTVLVVPPDSVTDGKVEFSPPSSVNPAKFTELISTTSV